jgi:hypothetical protein
MTLFDAASHGQTDGLPMTSFQLFYDTAEEGSPVSKAKIAKIKKEIIHPIARYHVEILARNE